MIVVGKLVGSGRVTCKGRISKRFGYSILVKENPSGRRIARGVLVGPERALQEIAMWRSHAELALQGGESVTILLTRVEKDRGEIEISGPIPGF
jgi:hypothetical protein